MAKINLDKIIEVIYDLNNKKGVTLKQIVTYLRKFLHAPERQKRDLVCSVRRILNQGLIDGKFKHRAGYYKLSHNLKNSCSHTFGYTANKENDLTTCLDLSSISSASDNKINNFTKEEQLTANNHHYKTRYHTFLLQSHTKKSQLECDLADLRDYKQSHFDLIKNLREVRRRQACLNMSGKDENRKRIASQIKNIQSMKRKNNARTRGKNKNKQRRCCIRLKRCERCGKFTRQKEKVESEGHQTCKNAFPDERKVTDSMFKQMKTRKRTCMQNHRTNIHRSHSNKSMTEFSSEDEHLNMDQTETKKDKVNGENRTPPPPHLDPDAHPGSNDIERRISQHSNPSQPPLKSDDEDDNNSTSIND